MHVIFNSLVLLICMSLNAIKIASRFFGAQPLAFQNDSSFLSIVLLLVKGWLSFSVYW